MSTRVKAVLCLLSGALLGFSYPPFETGILAAFGFVPFFLVLSTTENFTSLFRISYLMFFSANLISLYWPGGFVHGSDLYLMISGALLLLAHPLFMSLPVAAWFVVRRAFGVKTAIFSFPVLWVAFEYLHSSTQLAFPWLTLGNTQTYDLTAIQIASITGVYGLSFWLLVLNVLVFYLVAKIIVGEWKLDSWRSGAFAGIVLAVYAVPHVAGTILDPGSVTSATGTVRISLVQPDIDPFQKWEGDAESQVELLKNMTRSIADTSSPDLVVWPETAIPYYVLSPARRPEADEMRAFVDSLGIPLLTGIPDITYYDTSGVLPSGVKISWDDRHFQNFNSSMLLTPGDTGIQKCAKSLLVPFAEHVPYSDVLTFLNAAQWNFGLGGWSIGRDSTLFTVPLTQTGDLPGAWTDTARFSNLICYESIFPGYVASLVRKGAQFITIVTNDSWWGETAGPYQHMQFTVLRAVENRRWFLQCANGGISFFVDPSGRTRKETGLFTKAILTGEVTPATELTFYSRHGDWFAEIMLVVGFLLTGLATIHTIYRKRRGGRR